MEDVYAHATVASLSPLAGPASVFGPPWLGGLRRHAGSATGGARRGLPCAEYDVLLKKYVDDQCRVDYNKLKQTDGETIEKLIPERFQRDHPGQRKEYHHEPVARPMGIGLSLFARRKDGSEFPVDVNLSPVEVGGETQVICVVRDISACRMAGGIKRRGRACMLPSA